MVSSSNELIQVGFTAANLNLTLWVQVDVLLTEADELDKSETPMSFVTGRIQAPQQPQLLKARMLLGHSERVVAMLAREQKVGLCVLSIFDLATV